jgi:hypothetical protein
MKRRNDETTKHYRIYLLIRYFNTLLYTKTFSLIIDNCQLPTHKYDDLFSSPA